MPISLTEQLADDLLGWLGASTDGAPRRVLLWLDPHREFERLIESLASNLAARGARLLRSESNQRTSQLGLKLELLRLDALPGACAIVYLPGFDRASIEPRRDGSAPALWSVYEYRFKGCIWGNGKHPEPGSVPELPTLYGWLRHHGVKAVDEKTRRELTAGGADSRLARYAEKQRLASISDWPQPLRLSDVESALAGDWRDSLRRLLAAPNNEVKRWGDEKTTVLAHITAELGLTGLDGPLDAEELADRAALNLALVEAWDAFGRPLDFPYSARLPKKDEQQAKQISFVRDELLSHAELGPRFRKRVQRVEATASLIEWAKDRVGHPGGMPRLAQAQWQRFLAQLSASANVGWKNARDFLRGQRDLINSTAEVPWHFLDREQHWDTVARLADLVVQAEAILQQAESLKSAAAFVNEYAEEWWRVDELHLQILADARDAHLETIRDVAEKAYFDWASRLADRFFEWIEQEACWPPKGVPDVAGLGRLVWSASDKRTAMIITDACRWDVAHALAGKLDDGEVTLTPVAATLPTITPFGMAALLPLRDEPLDVEFGGGKLDGIRQGTDKGLDSRDGRKAFLRAHVLDAKGSPEVDFLDLDVLLKGTKPPATRIVVVFDNGLDEQGHKGVEQLPGLVPAFVRNLRHAIQRLHEAGFQTVHLVTDHGFLLVASDLVDGLGRPEVLPNQNLYKDDRWAALKPDAPVGDVLHIQAPLAPSITLGIPKGLRTLVKAKPFLHGGISLQECVIPHLVSSRALPRAQLGLDLQVSTDKLSGGTVPVVLRPRLEGQGLLGGVEPITVRVWVEAANGRTVAEPVDQELRPDVQELKPALYLREGSKLTAGEALTLRAQQIPSELDLGSVPLTMLVDWD